MSCGIPQWVPPSRTPSFQAHLTGLQSSTSCVFVPSIPTTMCAGLLSSRVYSQVAITLLPSMDAVSAEVENSACPPPSFLHHSHLGKSFYHPAHHHQGPSAPSPKSYYPFWSLLPLPPTDITGCWEVQGDQAGCFGRSQSVGMGLAGPNPGKQSMGTGGD